MSPASGQRRWFGLLIPVLLVAVMVAIAVRDVANDDSAPATSLPAAVDIAASGPRFDSLAELYAAASVVVEGSIVAADEGRVITDPTDPTVGVRTALFQLEVSHVYRGSVGGQLTIEQEAALLDATPIVVNGLEPNQVGDRGFWFLVSSDDAEFPYLALVNEQGRLLIAPAVSNPDGEAAPESVDTWWAGPVDADAVRADLAILATE